MSQMLASMAKTYLVFFLAAKYSPPEFSTDTVESVCLETEGTNEIVHDYV